MKISEGQRKLHIVSETIALLAFAPWLVSIAFKKRLSNFDKGFALFIAGGTVLVDGGLLATWLRPRAKEKVAAAEVAWARRRVAA